MQMSKIQRFFFYPEYHEHAGGLKAWIAGVLMVGVILTGGYIDGLEHAQHLGK